MDGATDGKPVLQSSVNYSVIFAFEKKIDSHTFAQWMMENWTHSFGYSILYLIVIFGGKFYMQKRPRYELRPALAIWSAILAVFSLMGALRTWPELLHSIHNHGLKYSICVPSYYFDQVFGFWAILFTLSKVYELGDTLFIILRKQQLIFLHWYHHFATLMYAWYSYTEYPAPARWFIVMNYTVHAYMYTYYALKAMKFNIPRWVNVVITSMQLTQMIIACVINIWIYNIKKNGEFCHQSDGNIRFALTMYLSYFILFGHFFYTTYMVKKPKSAKKIQ